MRIVFINYLFDEHISPMTLIDRYRTQRWVAEALASAGEEVVVLNRYSSGFRLEKNGVLYVFTSDNTSRGKPGIRTNPKKLHSILLGLNPDIIHVHSLMFYRQIGILRAAAGNNIPIVAQHHAERPARAYLAWLQRRYLRNLDGLLFNGAGNATEWYNAGVLDDASTIYEVPEGSADFVPVDYAAARQQTGITGNPAILFAARLEAAKDPVTAINGVAAFIKSNPGARMYMVFREGTLSDTIKSIVARDEVLSKSVTLIGRMNHESLAAYYSAADIFITAGPREGSNYALIEALACGAYPVCSDIPPHRYLTDNGRYASMFPPGNAAVCAGALAKAWQNAPSVSRQERVEYFNERLSFNAIAARLTDIYTQVLQNKSTQ